ncbi:hypothetical protein GNP35_06620 [Psychrosphaera haliotis]|uniref:Flagellar biosynthesis protein FlaG n=2 Tax=Psychrosphaera haliotis TaxID=555083 RepID=A0A6N8FB02_9GAMM|nr:hypothetical protein [Psychrosphaera haliotis]
MVMTMNTINAASAAAIQNQDRAGASQVTDINKKAEAQALTNSAVADVNGVESVKAVAEKESVAKVAEESQVDDQQQVLEDVASNLQEFVNLIDKELKFTVDTDTGRQVVTVKDGTNGEIIRQIPSEEVLKLAQNLAKITDVFHVSGNLLETKV